MTKWKQLLRDFHFMYFGNIDPVKHCEVYKKEGCSHVDGYLCEPDTCRELSEYRMLHKEI